MYNVYSAYDVEPVKGLGCYVWDTNNVKYLDFYGGHAVISIGHSHPHFVKSISDQLSKLAFYSNAVKNPLQLKLANLLEEVSGQVDYDLFLVNSGAEANENALKLASFYNNRNKIIALENGFHGRTSAAINVTHSGSKYQAPINRHIDVQFFDMNRSEEIISSINNGDVSAIIIEAIQGIGGLNQIDDSSLRSIREACTKNGTCLIMDEIQCGYQRAGEFFAFEKSGIRPDIITMAKGMGNGFPVGGLLIDKEKFPAEKGKLGTTFGGNHLACAASIAVLETIQMEELGQHVVNTSEYLKESLSSIPEISKIKGRGLMLGIELDGPVKELQKKLLYDYHVFTGSSINPNLIRILPPLCITTKDIDLFTKRLIDALK